MSAASESIGLPRERKKGGRFWPLFIVVLLGGHTAGLAYMVVRAADDPSFAVEEDYYQKGVRWDVHLAQLRRNAELGWRVDVRPIVRGLASAIEVILRDREGASLDAARVVLEAFPLARSADVQRVDLSEAPMGRYRAPLRALRAGRWELRFVVDARGERFTHTQRVDVLEAQP
jgi:hypothetical protein